MVSCSGFGLPMHAQLLRLFVTVHRSYQVASTQRMKHTSNSCISRCGGSGGQPTAYRTVRGSTPGLSCDVMYTHRVTGSVVATADHRGHTAVSRDLKRVKSLTASSTTSAWTADRQKGSMMLVRGVLAWYSPCCTFLDDPECEDSVSAEELEPVMPRHRCLGS